MCSFFFFNDTATTEIYTLSLHDALPISPSGTNLIDKYQTAWLERKTEMKARAIILSITALIIIASTSPAPCFEIPNVLIEENDQIPTTGV